MHSPFDIMAETYDADFTHSNIGQLQRKRVWDFLLPVLNSHSRPLKILEINCGTGEDALELSRLGHSVIATDASGSMIKQAKQKAALKGLPDVQFDVCSFDKLNSAFANEKFDLVLSNFGGLNCIDATDLEKLAARLSSMLNDHGKLFFVIMGSFCIWEMLYFFAKRNPAAAVRRQKKSASFSSGENEMQVFYHSPSRVRKIFEKSYDYAGSMPVGLFIPPSYLEKRFVAKPERLKRLEALERQIGSSSWFSNLADHFCIIFQKKENL